MPDQDVNINVNARNRATGAIQAVIKDVTGFGKGVSLAARAFVAGGAITGGMRAAAGFANLLKGDFAGALENAERLPFGLGEAVRAGRALHEAMTGAAEQAERMAEAAAAAAKVPGVFRTGQQGVQTLADMARGLREQAGMAGLSDTAKQRAAAESEFRRNTEQIKEVAAREIAAVRKQRDDAVAGKLREAWEAGKFGGADATEIGAVSRIDALRKARALAEEQKARAEADLQRSMTSGEAMSRSGGGASAASGAGARIKAAEDAIAAFNAELAILENTVGAANAAYLASERGIIDHADAARAAAAAVRDAQIKARRQDLGPTPGMEARDASLLRFNAVVGNTDMTVKKIDEGNALLADIEEWLRRQYDLQRRSPRFLPAQF
jgi:hypothetical protein